MGEVLRDGAQMPQTILSEHVAILDAIIAGNGAEAERLSRDHISRAAKIFVQRLQAQKEASEEEQRQRPTPTHPVISGGYLTSGPGGMEPSRQRKGAISLRTSSSGGKNDRH